MLIAFNTKRELMCADLLSLLFKIKFIKKMIPNIYFTYFTETMNAAEASPLHIYCLLLNLTNLLNGVG